jgi:GT2 family glycosyltransferase
MDISIITSLYKSELFLERYLKRVRLLVRKIEESDLQIEFILIANSISKAEESILKKNNIPNIRVVRVQRETLYASWNRGIREATSGTIGFWNVDDIRFSTAIIKGFKEIKKGSQIVYFPFLILGISKILLFNKKISIPLLLFKIVKAIPYKRELFVTGCMCGPFFIFKKSILEYIGPFDESFIVAGDFEWFARAAFKNVKFATIKSCGGIFFTHYSNLTVKNPQIQTLENEIVLKRYAI